MKCYAMSYYKWKGLANFRYQALHKRSGYKIFLNHRIIYMLSLKSEQGQLCCSTIKSKYNIHGDCTYKSNSSKQKIVQEIKEIFSFCIYSLYSLFFND